MGVEECTRPRYPSGIGARHHEYRENKRNFVAGAKYDHGEKHFTFRIGTAARWCILRGCYIAFCVVNAFPQYSTLYRLYTLHSRLLTPHSMLHTSHTTLHSTVHSALYTPSALCTPTPHSTLPILASTLHAPYSTPDALTQNTIDPTLFTLHPAIYLPPYTPQYPLLRSTSHTPLSTALPLHSPQTTASRLLPLCTLYTPHSTSRSACTIYTVHALYRLHSTPYSPLNTPHSTLHTFTLQHTLHSTLYVPQCTFAPQIAHSAGLYPAPSTLDTPASTVQNCGITAEEHTRLLPVVPHKAVAEVSKIGILQERLAVVNHRWQNESADGPKGGWSCVSWCGCNGCNGRLTHHCWL